MNESDNSEVVMWLEPLIPDVCAAAVAFVALAKQARAVAEVTCFINSGIIPFPPGSGYPWSAEVNDCEFAC